MVVEVTRVISLCKVTYVSYVDTAW